MEFKKKPETIIEKGDLVYLKDGFAYPATNRAICENCGRREKRGDNYENGSWHSPNFCSLACFQEYVKKNKKSTE